ncbi:hypothetical protein BYT27DRAFT_7069799, partial [Phlegmacium glaucopus]
RCQDCQGECLTCSSCTVLVHRQNPFHRVERWTGKYFMKISLKELGLCIQLGHVDGCCP